MTSMCTYRLGDLWCAIPACEVREVITVPTLTPVPRSPAWVLGLVNLRGEILAVVDAALRLGVNTPDRSVHTSFLLVVDSVQDFAVVLDGFGGVVDVSDEQLRDNPPNTPASLRPFLRGGVDVRDVVLQVLDLVALGQGDQP